MSFSVLTNAPPGWSLPTSMLFLGVVGVQNSNRIRKPLMARSMPTRPLPMGPPSGEKKKSAGVWRSLDSTKLEAGA